MTFPKKWREFCCPTDVAGYLTESRTLLEIHQEAAARRARVTWPSRQYGTQLLNEIVRILNSNGQAHETVADT